MATEGGGSSPPRGRPKLNLKPRDEAAAQKAALERAGSAKSNPFGAAKPREAVLAVREGKKEEDILKEEVKKHKIQLRLTREQLAEKEAKQEVIDELKTNLALEEDASKKPALQAELTDKQQELDNLLESFEQMALDRAKSGNFERPSEQRRLAEERALAQGGAAPGAYPAAQPGGYTDSLAGGYGGGGPPREGGFGGGGGGRRGGFGGRGGGEGGRGMRYDNFSKDGSAGGYQEYGNFSKGGGAGGYDAAPAYSSGGFGGPPAAYGGGYERDSFGGGGRGGRGGGRGAPQYGDGMPGGAPYGGAAGGDPVEYQSAYARQDRF